MPELFFLCFMGFCAGIIVAGGVSGLLIGLSIVPRYAGITRTADHILLDSISSTPTIVVRIPNMTSMI